METHELIPIVGLNEQEDDRNDPEISEGAGEIVLEPARLGPRGAAPGRLPCALAAGRTHRRGVRHLGSATCTETRHDFPSLDRSECDAWLRRRPQP